VYAPNQEAEKALKLRAFLNVDIFKRVLEYYKGSNLPEMKYLGNTLQKEFDLEPETHEEFSRTFRENCQYLASRQAFQLHPEMRAFRQAPSVRQRQLRSLKRQGLQSSQLS
jgi:hypothetical protein